MCRREAIYRLQQSRRGCLRRDDRAPDFWTLLRAQERTETPRARGKKSVSYLPIFVWSGSYAPFAARMKAAVSIVFRCSPKRVVYSTRALEWLLERAGKGCVTTL